MGAEMIAGFKPDRLSLGIAGVVAACVVYLLSVTWLRWGSLTIDTFRDMLLCREILGGHVPYRDIYYEYGFLVPYLLAGMGGVFGVHVLTFAAVGAGLTVILSVVIYRMAAMFLDRGVSAFTVLVFLFVFAFGFYQYHGIFNFILPYSFAAVFLVVFETSSLLWGLRFLAGGRRRDLAAWAVLQTACFLTRADAALLCWGAFAVTWVLHVAVAEKRAGERVFVLSVMASPILAMAAGYAMFFAAVPGTWAGFEESVVKHILGARKTPFMSELMGLSHLGENLSGIGASLLFQAVSAAVIGLGCLVMCRSLAPGGASRPAGVTLGVAAVFGAFLYAADVTHPAHPNSEIQYRCLPVILAAGALLSLVGICRRREVGLNLRLLMLYSVSLAVVARILFSVSPAAYGFCLCVPGLIAYHVFFIDRAGAGFARLFPDFPRALYAAVFVCLLTLLASRYWAASYSCYLQKTLRLQAGAEELLCRDDRQTRRIAEAVFYLRENTAPSDTVVVVPECSAVGFLAERRHDLYFYFFSPQTMILPGEEKVLASFAGAPPRYIVHAGRPTTEHGATAFGKDYACQLFAWILEHYEVCRQIGPPPFASEEFGITIFKRR